VSKAVVRWSDPAKDDLKLVYEYLAQRNPGAAAKLVNDILDTVYRLEDFPELGPLIIDLDPAEGCRHLVCGHYRLIYEIDLDSVYVHRIRDSRRSPNLFRMH